MTVENYQVKPIVKPTSTVVALDLLATTTTTSSAVNSGIVHVANSVACHADFNGSYEFQTIDVTPTVGVSYTLTVNTVVLTSGALGAAPTIADLVATLQSDGDYASAPFTVTANSTVGIKITWKSVGNIAHTAVLADDALGSYTTVTTNGTGGVSATCQLLMAGERTFIIGSSVLSFVRAAGASDGIIRITYCE